MKLFFIINAALLCMSATSAHASTVQENAFTRAAKKPLKNILTPVENKVTTPCGTIAECRALERRNTVWQVDNAPDRSPKDYPERCYVLGAGGKYYYQASSCR